jgi:hypothetical protein
MRPASSPLLSDRILDIRDIQELISLGNDNFGDLKRMEKVRTHEQVTMKFLPLPGSDDVDPDRIQEFFLHEIRILLKLHRPCVLAFK